ncbi:uncharacterized protein LTR77_006731 [Saxophila tyrrhenica]|uniref:Uncharacterized protein n=1 Tax=Saxophila tyrrhenica TaxID=1690608 RepID=A0AAV9P8J6_9PEZI|nr:hypothetical protein LTR77_006731 [Saxophila tyrrhenica]
MPPEPTQYDAVTPQDSATPLIISEQRGEQDGAAEEKDPKTGKRKFWGLGRKMEEQRDMAAATSSSTSSNLQPTAQQSTMRPPSPGKAPADLRPQSAEPPPIPTTPSRHPYPSVANAAASPSRLRSGSPRLHSPASSEIFERSVQEPVQMSTLTDDTEAHIPSHVITEDHIPPALEASAQAITSENLNADEVSIVMSASHQPAAPAVLEGSSSQADLTQLQTPPLQHAASQDSEHASSLHHSSIAPAPAAADDDGASNYGQLDPNDVRRLSFISFADVVQSEHAAPSGSALSDAGGNRDSLHIASLPSSFQNEARAASPLRSPRSPGSMQSRTLSGGGVTTPPPGVSGGVEQGSPPQQSELTIETMRQAVRKTASGDLQQAGGRGAGMSPVGSSEEVGGGSRSRGNS